MSRVPPRTHSLPHVAETAPAHTEPDRSAASTASIALQAAAAPSTSRAGTRRHAFLHWIGRQVQQTRSVLRAAVQHPPDAALQLEQRRHVLTLLDRSVELVDRADHCLDIDRTRPVQAARDENAALLKALTMHLKEIRQLTVIIENQWVGDPEYGLVGAGALALGAGPPHSREPAQAITIRCLEVMNALPRLCIAASRPQPTASGRVRLTDYYFEIDEKLPLGADLEDMLVHAALAQTIYTEDLDVNLGKVHAQVVPAGPPRWRHMRMDDGLRAELYGLCANLRELDDGRLCDPDSGLVMQLFENPATRKLVIAFGGTSAGEAKGPLLTRLMSNPWITATQWRANLAGATGLSLLGGPVPDCYARAAETARVVCAHLRTSRQNEPWQVSLTGHSKGGAEAEYAALATGLRAACFGTPELGRGVLETFGTEQLKAGACNIRHYFVKGDIAPVVSTLLAHVVPDRFAHVGTGYWMEPTPEVGTLPLSRNLWCHDLFFDSALRDAARQTPPPETCPPSP